MNSFLWVCFTNRPEKVQPTRAWIGEPLFHKVKFWIGAGRRAEFEAEGVAAGNVHEIGRVVACFNRGFEMATETRMPVVFFADDIQSLHILDGAPNTWANGRGRVASAVDAAKHLEKLCKDFGGKLAGCYPKDKPFEALQLPAVQLSHFICADFCVAMPDIRIKWRQDSWPKEDLDATMLCLAQNGVVCRSNRIIYDAEHHRPGGDGDGPARVRADRNAVKFLVTEWEREGAAKVFRSGRSDSEIRLVGLALVRRFHADLAEAIADYNVAASVTRFSAEQAKECSRQGRDAAKSPVAQQSSATHVLSRQKKRYYRGTAQGGRVRRAGRHAVGPHALTQSQRNALCRTRAAVRKCVKQILRKRSKRPLCLAPKHF